MPAPVLPASPTLNDYQTYIAAVEALRGFDSDSAQDCLLMLTEELGELAKALRKHSGVKTATDSHSHSLSNETADLFFLLCSLANRLHIPLETAFREKEALNQKRVWK